MDASGERGLPRHLRADGRRQQHSGTNEQDVELAGSAEEPMPEMEIGTSGLNPTECSGPPHLLGPWGSAGPEAMGVASSKTSLLAGHLLP